MPCHLVGTPWYLLRQKLLYENKFLCDFYISGGGGGGGGGGGRGGGGGGI